MELNTLAAVLLFWVALFAALTLFGIACIKWGTYSAGNHENKPTLNI